MCMVLDYENTITRGTSTTEPALTARAEQVLNRI